MKKMVLLLAGLVALTACSQSKQATKESTSNQTTKETKVSDRKSTRLNSSHLKLSRMPSSA